jgi:prophage regulatory protein
MHQLPETGFLTLKQIIGQDEVTEEQAEANRKRGKGPKRPRKAIPAVIPVKKSTWWNGIRTGRFPAPEKIGNGRGAFWRVARIRAITE